MDLKRIKHIHFTGIKGVGMTALALCAQDLGKKVTGSDTDEVFPTDTILKQRKINLKIGFSSKNLPKKCDLVIYTGAHGGSTNPEVVEAVKQNIPVLSHAKALALFINNQKTLAVAGVGGKSSTSAMLATILDHNGYQPSFAIGVGNIDPLNTPGRFNKKSNYFVVEADEYVTDPLKDQTPRFHHLNPFHAIITNIEHDHPDVYPSLKSMINSFTAFVANVPKDGLVIANIDNPNVKTFLQKIDKPVATYGFSPQADWQIIKTHIADKKQFFKLKFKNMDLPDFILDVPGEYNALNAVAAIASSYNLGLSFDKIRAGLKKFKGTKRRFEYIGEAKNIELYDDYAHHPIEIQALLKAAKNWLPHKKVIAIFQSHTYSRTKTLLQEFSQSFKHAHTILINDIFASAREKDNLGLTGEIFTKSVKNYSYNTHYCAGKKETLKFLKKYATKDNVIFTIGAGDNWLWHKDILKTLRQK
ncbi:UDP-N-acetylmuramate--L-alanine ligase [Patescibacteria group bacterium]